MAALLATSQVARRRCAAGMSLCAPRGLFAPAFPPRTWRMGLKRAVGAPATAIARPEAFLTSRLATTSAGEPKTPPETPPHRSLADRTVDMINDRITKYPREAIAGIMCMEILGIYGAHQLLVLSGVQVPAEYALAFAMGRPLRRLRFPLELAAAGLLCRIEPALQRVRVTDAIAKAVPQRLRERWSSNDTLKASGEAVGKAIDGYGAAYFIGARYVGVGVVLTFYAAIMQGFDVTNFLAGYGFQNFGTVLGTWAAAVSMSAILYPCTIAAGAALSPAVAGLVRQVSARIVSRR